MSNATSVEKVLAALVNLEVAGQVSSALGGPKWAGRLISALGMAAAGDDSVPKSPVLENAAEKTRSTGARVWDAVNKEWITDEPE